MKRSQMCIITLSFLKALILGICANLLSRILETLFLELSKSFFCSPECYFATEILAFARGQSQSTNALKGKGGSTKIVRALM